MPKGMTIDQAFNYAMSQPLPSQRIAIDADAHCVEFNSASHNVRVIKLNDALTASMRSALHRQFYLYRIIAIGSYEECQLTCNAMK